MKNVAISLIALLFVTAGIVAQEKSAARLGGKDLLGALNGDMERFERGMKTLEEALARNPNDPEVKVVHGNGVLVRAGEAFKKGDMENGANLWESGLAEMDQAVKMAPENIFVRARRGVFLITTSRSMPAEMSKPLLELAVADFSKVLQVREKDQTLSRLSDHQHGELLSSLADGWNRLGDSAKARSYFDRVSKELPGTIYEQRARAWLADKPETKAADYFACRGCHVD